LHTENDHLCQVITTFTTGLTALNGLTTQVQFFAVGTSGTDFAISSATDTHTFNLPTASATNRGALSSADWSTFNAKMPAITFNSPLFIASGGEVGITQASGSTNGFLSSTDWTTFNNKQNALTNPVTGTGTTNTIPKFTGSTTIGNSQVFDNGTNVGVGTNTPAVKLDVSGEIRSTSTSGYAALLSISALNFSILADSHTGGAMTIWTAGSEKMRVFSDGNVGINTGSTNAGFKLDVNGTGRFSGAITGTQYNATSKYAWGSATNGTTGQVATDNTHNYFDYIGNLYFRGAAASNTLITFTAAGAATFSSSVTANANEGFIIAPSSGASYMNYKIGSTSYSLIGIAGTTSDIIAGSALGDLNIRATNSQKILFSTNNGGSAAMTITSGGNVLIGTTTDAGFRLQVNGEGRFYQSATNTSAYLRVENNRARNAAIRLTTTVGDYYLGVGIGADVNQFQIFDGNAGETRLTIASTGAATFSGDVTISKTSPTFRLTRGTTSASSLLVYNTNGTDNWLVGTGVTGSNTDYRIYNNSLGADAIYVVNSSNNVLIGTTSQLQSNERLAITTSTNTAILAQFTGGSTTGWAAKFWNNGTSGDNLIIEFLTETSITARGSVTYNRGSGVTAFNTTSDYRIKSEISDFNSLKIISNLKPKEFKIGNAPRKTIGFIAHELQEFFPQAVTGIKDQIDNFGNPIYQSVDYSQLTGLLVKAIQELKQEINTLKNS
jgi:hypothetical protein